LRCSSIISIFIVEDDHSLRLLYEKALKLNGYNVVGSAKDGEEAVNMYNRFSAKPDIILMDHRMPIKNGIEATKEIFQNSSNLKPKIIFISADRSIKETALSIGVISFKDKPFSLYLITLKKPLLRKKLKFMDSSLELK
jgi:two-component system chemotaxis response regulator CheY